MSSIDEAVIDLIVNSGRNGSGALCAEHDGKVRGPRIQTCHVVLGSRVNADLAPKKSTSQSINIEGNNLQFSLTVKGFSIYKSVHF